MYKLLKRLPQYLLSMFAVVMIFIILPTEANAASESDLTFTLNSDGQSYSVTDCNSSASGALAIPATYNGKPVTSIGPWAFNNCANLSSVTIPDSLTTIGQQAFDGCGLTSIIIGNGVTTIGLRAFQNCINLSSVTIPDGVTTIDWQAFDGCTGLTSVIIGNGVTTIGPWAFQNCTNLSSVTIPDSVATIEPEAFNGCAVEELIIAEGSKAVTSTMVMCKDTLKKVEIPEGVTTINSHAFQGCSSLTEISIPESVIYIGDSAFVNCTGLTTVNFNPINCTTMGAYRYPVFTGCTKLATVNIGNGVTNIPDAAFYCCTGLTSVTIPNSVTRIGDRVFYGCTALSKLNIPNSVISIGYSAFCDCISLTEITIPNGVTSINASVFYGCTGLTSITIPNNVTSIDNLAFYDCTGLISVTISDSVTSIGQDAFKNSGVEQLIIADGSKTITCEMVPFSDTLKRVVIPNSVITISYSAFAWCTELTKIAIPSSVTTIGISAFEGCTGLTSITIPDGVTTIGSSAFEGCTGLTGITIPDSVTSIGDYAFSSCDSLTSVTIGNGVTSIGRFAFVHCIGLTSITIPDSVTTIGQQAFDGCTGLTSVTMGNCVTTIGSSAFEGCTGLTSITIPDGVTTIGSSAFEGCTGLTGITIPDSVITIGNSAFYLCTGLDSVVYCGVQEQWNAISIGSTNTPLTEAKLKFHDYQSGVCIICNDLCLYTIIFKDADGTELSKQTYHWGDKVNIPVDPVRAADRTYTYTFVGWDIDVVENCAGDATYTATYTKKRNDGLLYSIQTGEVTITGYTGNAGELYIPYEIENLPVTKIGENAFKNCSSLSFVYIPESVISIESVAFLNCTGLTEIAVPNSVTSIGYGAFVGCSGLESMTLPFVGDGSGDYPLGWIFGQAIGNISYPGFSKVTQKYVASTTIYSNDFFIPDSLKSVTVTGSVIGYGAFSNCTGLTTVSMLTSSPEAYIHDYAFSGCSNLESLVLPTAPTDICRIFGSEIYSGSYGVLQHNACSDYFGSKKTYYLPRTLKNLTITRGQIGECAFDSCYMLENVVLGSGVHTIDRYAFYLCGNLKSVHLPKITYCAADAFDDPWGPNGEDDVQDVWYTGTLSDRENIVYNTYGNKAWFLRNATWHYSTCAYGHTYSSSCDTTCNRCEWVRNTSIDHIYDNECDTTCNLCDNTRTVPHSYVEGVCEYCGGLATYVVVFTDEDGTELSSNTYHWGEPITIPANPTKSADNTNTYTFAGWDKPVVNCTGNVVYTATYEKHYIMYEVSFKNWNGDVISLEYYHWGETITIPANPNRPADNTYTYTYNGWDKNVIECAGDATYTATYNATYINYMVEFKDWDGTVISTQTYHWGDAVMVPNDPARAADNIYTYSFDEWENYYEEWKVLAVNCAGNATYIATYNATYIDYIVAFKNWDGTLLSSTSYHYGDEVVVPAEPTKEAEDGYYYSFSSWDQEITACDGDKVYFATFKSWKFEDVNVTSWQIAPVVYVCNRGLMAGKGTDANGNIKFDPNSPISREEFAQVLYNAENKPSVTIANRFPDVANNSWYKNAVLWANQAGIASGMGDGRFGVGKNITRQDLAMMLYKYAKMKNCDLTATEGMIDQFADGDKVAGYAKTAMDWAVTNRILSGKGTAGADISTFRLDPAGTATRAECAAMLKNFMEAFGL